MILFRSFLFNIVYFLVSAGFSIYGIAVCHSQPSALRLAKRWARVSIRAAKAICALDFRVTGWEHVPSTGPALLACQHQSAFDTMIWLQLLPRTAYVMKQEVAQIPLFGRLTVRAGMIPVDRGGGGASLRGLMRAAAASVARDKQLVIFPEGTRARPGDIVPLQPGIAAVASHTGLPVIPVRTDSGQFWGRRAFRKFPGTIAIDILPPLPARTNRATLIAALATAFHTAVDNPVDDRFLPL